MDIAFVLKSLLLAFTINQGCALRCYVCNTHMTEECGSKFGPEESLLKDSGNKSTICFFMSVSNEQKGQLYVHRGIAEGLKELPKQCNETNSANETRPKQSIGNPDILNRRRRKRRRLIKPKINLMLVQDGPNGKIIKRPFADPDSYLESEEDDEEVNAAGNGDIFTCRTCITDGCNWITSQHEEDNYSTVMPTEVKDDADLHSPSMLLKSKYNYESDEVTLASRSDEEYDMIVNTTDMSTSFDRNNNNSVRIFGGNSTFILLVLVIIFRTYLI